MTKAYVVKVTSVGQVTLPKEVREELDVGKDDYIVIEKTGEAYFIKKLDVGNDLLERVRDRVRKSGITRERFDEIIEEESRVVWDKRQSLS